MSNMYYSQDEGIVLYCFVRLIKEIQMDKWVLQIMDGQNWEHALIMVNNNLGKLDLKVVALGLPLSQFLHQASLEAPCRRLLIKV